MNIVDVSNYDLEDTIQALTKIQAIADLFNAERDDEFRNLTTSGCQGIHSILLESVAELKAIIWQEVDRQFEEESARRKSKELLDKEIIDIRLGK